jgi:hypothetical protein
MNLHDPFILRLSKRPVQQIESQVKQLQVIRKQGTITS